MKKIKYFALASVCALGLTSCGDFGDLNVDPEHLNESNVPVAMLFSNAQHQALGSDWDLWRTGCIYSAQFTQQLASIGWWDMYGRYNYSDGYSSSFWDTFSGDRGAMRDVTTCYDKWSGKEAYKVDFNMARVMRIYAFAKMSDLYGDIPYTEAGRPLQFSYPKYDKQEDIYKSMLKELDEAQANLTGTALMGSQDLYYNGQASKWKTFANSLMLRLAMRLVKVDPATAKTYAATAVANGVMASNDDNCILRHTDGVTTNDSAEPFAKIISHEDREFYLTNVFVDMLKNTSDPRLSMIATKCGIRYDGEKPVTGDQVSDIQQKGGWTETNTAYKDGFGDYGNMSAAVQNGMPVGGYSTSPTSKYAISAVDPWMAKTDANIVYTYKDKEGKDVNIYNYQLYYSHYSTVNRYTYADPKAPTFVVTYAQTCFLLAEAAQRGYISGSAKTYYENGVKAAFAQFSQFPNGNKAMNVAYSGGGADAAATAYLAANPFNAGEALKQINTQYYICTFGDPHEVFANWRRSGYPELKSAVMAQEDGLCATENGAIPRRFRYPSAESQVNKTNYDAAGKNMGGDTFSTRVWWDK